MGFRSRLLSLEDFLLNREENGSCVLPSLLGEKLKWEMALRHVPSQLFSLSLQ